MNSSLYGNLFMWLDKKMQSAWRIP